MTTLEEIGISRENVERFTAVVSQEAFVLEDVAEELGLSVSEARFILRYLIDNGILSFRQVWVPLKNGAGENKELG